MSGVRLPQMCTLAVAIAGSGVAPTSTSQLTAQTSSWRKGTPSGYCTQSGVRSYAEWFQAKTSGSLRGVPARGRLNVEMSGCSDGQVIVSASSATTAQQATSSGLRKIEHRVTARLSQTAGDSQAYLSYTWSTLESQCTQDGSACRPVTTQASGSRPGETPLTVPVAIRNTGMAARVPHIMDSTTYDSAGQYQDNTTSQALFEIGASVSGRWARTVHTVSVGDEPSRSFRATVKPEPGLWRVGIGA